MKLLVALFIVINVAVFLWGGGDRDTQDLQYAYAKADVNKQGMLLVPEITDASKNLRPNSFPIKPNNPDNKNVSATTPELCLRVGPFEKDTFGQQSLDWLKSLELDYQVVSANERKLKATRIVVGPFKTQQQAQTQINILKQKSLEYYVRTLSDGDIRISLGYFLQKKLADKFLDHILSLGIDAHSESEFKTLEPYSWLEIPMKTDDLEKTLRQRWPNTNIKITQVNCQQ